ncbi:MAG TPA: aldehyde dehydrogenase family protein, partial [Spirochaetia bacterium]|nr:aldehyde dehydrogenase family protein [Spirochaetia bacterium]
LSTEVLPAALAINHYARAVGREISPKRSARSSILFFNKKTVIRREPLGVVGIISPWNYPFGIPIHEVITALLSGNGVVLKVATQAQPVGELIAEMIEQSGFPRGLFQLVHLPGKVAGSAFLNSGIAKLFFTGSTEVGKLLMEEAGRSLVPVSLELGGNDAMIVLDDANLARAAAGAVWAGISNCGQSCGGVERIYVEARAYDPFIALLSKKVAVLRQGTDIDFTSDFGSLTTREQFQTVQSQVDEALAEGGVIRAKSPAEATGLFFPAMVLEMSNSDSRLMRDETFGPVLALERVADEAEAVRKANASYLGLTASVWTMNKNRGERVAAALEAGTVTVNDHLMSHGMAEAPWGGYKQSGIGRAHGIAGIREMTQEKAIVTELLPGMIRNMWWHPHSREVYDGLKSALTFLFGHGAFRRVAAGLRVVRLFLDAAMTKEERRK